jgi:GNAT superfamily N-acetyltransferase
VSVQKRLFMAARLDHLPRSDNVSGIAEIRDADLPELARLMASAYAGTVDDEGESVEDALAELQKTAGGEYGEPLRDTWLAARVEQGLAGAVLCTRWRGRPFVAFVFTDHPFTGHGIATRLLAAAAARLRSGGEDELTLWVTAANPAVRLYERLGFRVEETKDD